jgi:hypothetical protein
MTSMLKKKVQTMATPPIVGVDLLCEERIFGVSSTFTPLINIKLMATETKKRNNANRRCLDNMT